MESANEGTKKGPIGMRAASSGHSLMILMRNEQSVAQAQTQNLVSTI